MTFQIESVTIGEKLERRKREFNEDLRGINFPSRSQQREKHQPVENYGNISISKLQMSFNDELYRFQWYLVRFFISIQLKQEVGS